MVVLAPRESLFLRSRHYLAVAHEAGSRVMIKSREAENRRHLKLLKGALSDQKRL
jgi:hypothetical protein